MNSVKTININGINYNLKSNIHIELKKLPEMPSLEDLISSYQELLNQLSQSGVLTIYE